MEIGTILIWLALATGIVSIGFSILSMVTGTIFLKRFAQLAGLGCFFILSAALVLLTYYFMTSDFSVDYVYGNTDSDFEWYYKLVGVWVGIEGTLLIWTWFIALGLQIEEFYQFLKGRKNGEKEKVVSDGYYNKKYKGSSIHLFNWVRLGMMIAIVAFMGLLVIAEVFAPTEDVVIPTTGDPTLEAIVFNPGTMDKEIILEYRDGSTQIVDPQNPPSGAVGVVEYVEENYGNGRGVNYLLITPLMIVHPPVEFAAYAFTTLVLAAALVFLATGNDKWIDVGLRWGRWAWLFYTLGLGLGALWAYIVLGWGGYWAWDPVETANLIPWIALTAFLHAQLQNKKRGDFKLIAPALAVSAFLLTLLSRFITKTGIWLSSVHTFGGAEDISEDPVIRTVEVLNANESAYYLLTIMLAALLLTLIGYAWRSLNDRLSDTYDDEERSVSDLFITPEMAIIFGLSFLTAYMIFDLTGFINSIADLSETIGQGNRFLGLVILCVVIISIPVIWMIISGEEKEEDDVEEPGSLYDKLSTIPAGKLERYNMYITVTLLSLGVIAVVAIMFLGVNGMTADDFDSKAPYIVIPLVGVLGLCLGAGLLGRYIGKANTIFIISLIILYTVIAFFLFPDRLVFVVLPVLILAFIASGYRIFDVINIKLSRDGGMDNAMLKIAGILLIVAGLFGMFIWSSGANPLKPLVVYEEPTLPLVVTGFIISVIAFVAGVSAIKKINFDLTMFGAACAIFSIGMFVNVALGAVAAFFVLRARYEFPEQMNFTRLKASLRPMSAHLIHFGVILIIIGYVTTNNMSEETLIDSLVIGDAEEFGGYEFIFLGAEGTDTDGFENDFEIIVANIEIKKGGTPVGVVEIIWEFTESVNSYTRSVEIESTLFEDLYFTSLGMISGTDGLIRPSPEDNIKFTSDDITTIAFLIKIIPLVSFVWSGLWFTVVGITFRLGVDYLPSRRKVEKEEEFEEEEDYEEEDVLNDDDDDYDDDDEAEEESEKDDYYEDLIERELAMLGGKSSRKPASTAKVGRKVVVSRPTTRRVRPGRQPVRGRRRIRK